MSDLAVDEADRQRGSRPKGRCWFFRPPGRPRRQLPQQPGGITDIIKPTGPWVATAGEDGRVLVWSTRTTSRRPIQPTYELLGNGSAVEKVEFLRDGSLIAKSADGRLREWTSPTPPRLTGHTDWVRTH